MIYNTSPKEILSNEDSLQKLKSILNNEIKEELMLKLNTSNITMTNYSGRMKYDVEILGQAKKTRVMALNLNTQFQSEVEIKKTKKNFVFDEIQYENIETYDLNGAGTPIVMNDVAVAEYFQEVNHLNILVDLDDMCKKAIKIFKTSKNENAGKNLANFILKILSMLAAKKALIEFEERNWKNKEKRKENLKILKQKSTKLIKDKINSAKSEISNSESRIEDSKNRIVKALRTIQDNEKIIETYEKGEEEIVQKLIKELDAITENVYVKAVSYTGSSFEFITNYLPIYDGDKIWEGSEYIVKLNMDNSQVEIRTLDGKGFKGYWTLRDPHPHVNYESAKPCLGSIGGTIAELVGKHELYVLVVIMVEYLKSVNRDDSAGRRINESGRELLTQEEHDELMSYEREKVEEIVPIEQEDKKEKEKIIKKMMKKKIAPVVEEMPVEQVIASSCVHCSADVYSHGNYEAVMDVREGREDIVVACRNCITSENGFVSHPSGLHAYTGNAVEEVIEAELADDDENAEDDWEE